MKAQLIITSFYDSQFFIETEIMPENLTSEEKLKQVIYSLLTTEEINQLCKVSCSIATEKENLPNWYIEANGKLWFNDHLRVKYGLN